ncbi:hypothetical protein KIV56_00545 [Cryobacterium breve]|uniref:Uncharacterized protein n=1 Tax=Cryobacterium breve TaxID=1259258 RepID=A0ABY7NEV4_9MICO|nr:hypothetical protein KIV56_00545 [Cryobacterium breve]
MSGYRAGFAGRGGFRNAWRPGEGLAHVIGREVVADADHDEAEQDLLADHPQRIQAGDRGEDEGDHREDLAEQPEPQVGPVEAFLRPPGEVEEGERHREHDEGAHPDRGRNLGAAEEQHDRDDDRGSAEDQFRGEEPQDRDEGAPGPGVPAHLGRNGVFHRSPTGDPVDPEEQRFQFHDSSGCQR